MTLPKPQQPPWTLRCLDPGNDLDLVVASWLTVLEHREPYSALGPHHINRLYKPLVRELATPISTIVACDPEDPSELAGYLCGDQAGRVLHWVSVKPAYKRLGIGSLLMGAYFGDLGEEKIRCTFWTKAARHRSKDWGLISDSAPLRKKV